MRSIRTGAQRSQQAALGPPGPSDAGLAAGQTESGQHKPSDAGLAPGLTETSGLPGWWSLAMAFAAGLALAAAFPPVAFWPLAMAGPALLTLAVWGKGRMATLGLGLTCGGVFFVALLSWLVNVAWYAWMTLAVLEAVIFALLTLALRPLLTLRAWPLAVAGWWVAQEAVRDRFPWGGFPWGRLAMSQPGAPTAGWAAIGGPPLLTFLLALVGGCLAYLVITVSGMSGPDRVRRGLRLARADAGAGAAKASTAQAGAAQAGGAQAGAAQAGGAQAGAAQGGGAHAGGARAWRRPAAAAAVAVLAVGAALAGNLVWTWRPSPGPTALVATVQGDVPHARNLPNLLRATRVTANHEAATIALANQVRAGRRPAPDIVIWPENSTDIDPSLSPATYEAIATAVAAIDRPVLVGAVLDNPVRNAGQLWLPDRGPTQVYIKRQLVPFGEVIPLRSLIDKFTSLPSLQPQNFTPGHRAVVFRVGKIRLGDVICYEVGFDNLVRSEVLAGANLLAVQTNDADFEVDGQLGETLQQLAMARMDAITTGRAVAVASTIGVSAIIAPDGAILTRSGTWQRAELEARVPLESQLTPADRVGDWPELIIVGLTVLGLLWALGTERRRRRAS